MCDRARHVIQTGKNQRSISVHLSGSQEMGLEVEEGARIARQDNLRTTNEFEQRMPGMVAVYV